MASTDSSPRVGRSQGASIFWGLVSLFFATAACLFYINNIKNEHDANRYRNDNMRLQEDNDMLTAEKDKLQASKDQMKAREDFLDDKEAKLAAQEAHLEALGLKTPNPATVAPAPPPAPPKSSATVPKKFTDTIQKLGQADGAEVATRGGRPVLRIPNATLFAPGDAALKPDGQAFLNQIAQSLTGVSDVFELRIETFTDTDMESDAAPAKTDAKTDAKKDATKKPRYATSWELTSARAAAIAKYYRDQTSLTFQNVLVDARGDSQPTPGAKDALHNRRIEISIAPLPAAFHTDDVTLPAPSDTPTPAKAKDKAKSKDKDKDKDTDKAK